MKYLWRKRWILRKILTVEQSSSKTCASNNDQGRWNMRNRMRLAWSYPSVLWNGVLCPLMNTRHKSWYCFRTSRPLPRSNLHDHQLSRTCNKGVERTVISQKILGVFRKIHPILCKWRAENVHGLIRTRETHLRQQVAPGCCGTRKLCRLRGASYSGVRTCQICNIPSCILHECYLAGISQLYQTPILLLTS